MKLQIQSREDDCDYDIFIDNKRCMTCDLSSAYTIELFFVSMCTLQNQNYEILSDLS